MRMRGKRQGDKAPREADRRRLNGHSPEAASAPDTSAPDTSAGDNSAPDSSGAAQKAMAQDNDASGEASRAQSSTAAPLERASPKAARPGLPLLPPKIAMAELLAFFFFVFALEWGWQSFPDLNDLQPHPFWLPVLLLSLQYGTVSGLLAAGAAILTTAVFGWPEQDIGENHFNYLIRIWTQPVLWIGAAMLLGQFRIRQIAERRELLRINHELNQQRTAIVAHSENLRARCDRLERKMAGARAPSATALLDGFAILEQQGPEALQEAFTQSMEAAFGPGQYSMFIAREHSLQLVANAGWGDDAKWSELFETKSQLYRALMAKLPASRAGAGLTVLREADEPALSGEGLAAVVIASPSAVRMLGMIKAEYMEPRAFDHHVLERMAVVAAQFSPVLEHMNDDEQEHSDKSDAPLGARRKFAWRRSAWQSPAPLNPPRAGGDNVLKKPSITK